ncbi:MAG: hypothetical protein EOO12_16675 [Chitinophagaceae bacterium]|nr:MAG: hypothetical protein EOO12_16675 [Chitinophagaceae bacterium]
MNFDLEPMMQRDVYRQAMAVRGRRNEGDCLLLQLAERRRDSIRNFPGRFCLQDAGLHFFSDTASLPMDFISEAELERLRRLPPVDSMDATGLQRYVSAILGEKARLDSLSKGGADPSQILYHAYHRLRILMAAVGYSPLYHNAQFEALLRRFQSDPKTAGLVRQLLQED